MVSTLYHYLPEDINTTPKGSDTVPAMLTPGEFVVNKQSTQKHLPLLKSINSGSCFGGKVGYYASGGFIKKDPDKAAEVRVSDEAIDRTLKILLEALRKGNMG